MEMGVAGTGLQAVAGCADFIRWLATALLYHILGSDTKKFRRASTSVFARLNPGSSPIHEKPFSAL